VILPAIPANQPVTRQPHVSTNLQPTQSATRFFPCTTTVIRGYIQRMLNPDLVRELVRTALAEDMGAGDITTEASIPADAIVEAVIIAKDDCVVAGMPFVPAVFNSLDPHLSVVPTARDGDLVAYGARVCHITGNARAILTGERTALNFIQRLSGIATITRAFVDAVAGSKATILDTRKTTPTLRIIEKYAVACGGGQNHRFGLFDAMMVKDNHRQILDRLGPNALGDAIHRVRLSHPAAPIIVEADSIEQVEQALAAGAVHILLDNMTTDELREAVALVNGRAKLEASGGVTLETVTDIAATGVDYISVGALTHSAGAADFSLDLIA
jgi:nicotinate-nucleotide pyrophosphorylase (carboxylating)